jgi:hypothetical protein
VQCPLLALLSRHDERAAECLLSGGKADIAWKCLNVRYRPEADVRAASAVAPTTP